MIARRDVLLTMAATTAAAGLPVTRAAIAGETAIEALYTRWEAATEAKRSLSARLEDAEEALHQRIGPRPVPPADPLAMLRRGTRLSWLAERDAYDVARSNDPDQAKTQDLERQWEAADDACRDLRCRIFQRRPASIRDAELQLRVLASDREFLDGEGLDAVALKMLAGLPAELARLSGASGSQL